MPIAAHLQVFFRRQKRSEGHRLVTLMRLWLWEGIVLARTDVHPDAGAHQLTMIALGLMTNGYCTRAKNKTNRNSSSV